MEKWEHGYRRKVLDYIGAPDGVDLETVTISMVQDPGYAYSSMTFEDPHMEMSVQYIAPADVPYPTGWHRDGNLVNKGQLVFRTLDADDIVSLVNSF